MNERIRELVRESNLDMYGVGKERHRWEYTVDKFAELIVRECIEQVITGPNGPAHYAVEAALRLKKHFGVEE